MSVLGHGLDEEKIVGKLGNPYSLIEPGASIKPYPCGSLLHPSMDTLLEIVLEEDIKPHYVREVRLRAGPNILKPLRYDRPVNALQAKFSIQFGLGCILVRRRASLREYIPEALKSREIVEAMNKVRTFHDPKLAGMGTDKMRSVIEVELLDGRTFRRHAEAARGTPEKPLKSTELFGKFRECANYVVDERKIVRIYSLLKNIENLNNINDLTSLLQCAR
jgi:2-methylcitrate dehydratase PrpD